MTDTSMIASAWVAYREAFLQKASHRELRLMRVAFYSGFISGVQAVVRNGADGIDDHFVERLAREANALSKGAE